MSPESIDIAAQLLRTADDATRFLNAVMERRNQPDTGCTQDAFLAALALFTAETPALIAFMRPSQAL
jgi:hypothetical protein